MAIELFRNEHHACLMFTDLVEEDGQAVQANQFLIVDDDTGAIIAATKLLEPGQSETLKMTAIRNEGTYEYVCTFPGHWLVMQGEMVVE